MAVTLGQYKAHFWTWTNSWEEFRQVQAPEYKPWEEHHWEISGESVIYLLLNLPPPCGLWALPILFSCTDVQR